MEEEQPKKIKKPRKKSTKKKVSETPDTPTVKLHTPRKKKAYHLSDLSSYPLSETTPIEPTVSLSVTPVATPSFSVSSWRSYVYVSAGVTVAFLLLLTGVWFLPTPQQYSAAPNTQNLEKELGEIFLMPTEKPIIATVTNAELLKSEQVFYMNAANGDTLFLFKEKRFAILYRSTEHKIVNASPVYLPGDVYISLSDTKPEVEEEPEEEVSETPVLE